MNIRQLVLNNKNAVLETLQKRAADPSAPEIQLYSFGAGDVFGEDNDDEWPDPEITLHHLGAGEGDGAALPDIELAVLTVDEAEQFLDENENASPDSLDPSGQIQLYSIIYAAVRPGPAFQNDHSIWSPALATRIWPGKETWQAYLDGLNPSVNGVSWSQRMAAIARQCVRLNTASGSQAGSGFLGRDGRIFTARHVIDDPGFLFGAPPPLSQPPQSKHGKVRYNRVHDDTEPPDTEVMAVGFRRAASVPIDAAALQQSHSWRDIIKNSALPEAFRTTGALGGLDFHAEHPGEAYLKELPVAVIGHPKRGNEGGTSKDIPGVFGDAALGTKRFMPGFLDSTEPLDPTGTRLKHDCSTLGGASGSCLIDLKSGKVLGIHFFGSVKSHNMAIPIWEALKEL